MSIKVYGPTILVTNTTGQRNILISTSNPTVLDGVNGDVWLKYTAQLMPKYVKVQGTWRAVDESADCGKVKVNGVWRTVTNSYVKVGLLWKDICSPATTTVTTTVPVTTATTATTSLPYPNIGSVSAYGAGSGQAWTTNAAYVTWGGSGWGSYTVVVSNGSSFNSPSSAGGPPVLITGLSAGTSYSVTVTLYANANYSGASASASTSFTTASSGGVTTVTTTTTAAGPTGTVYLTYCYQGSVYVESYVVDSNNIIAQNINNACSAYTSLLSGIGATSISCSTSGMPTPPSNCAPVTTSPVTTTAATTTTTTTQFTFCPSLGYSVPTSGYPGNCPGAVTTSTTAATTTTTSGLPSCPGTITNPTSATCSELGLTFLGNSSQYAVPSGQSCCGGAISTTSTTTTASQFTFCPSLGYSVPLSGYPGNCPGAQTTSTTVTTTSPTARRICSQSDYVNQCCSCFSIGACDANGSQASCQYLLYAGKGEQHLMINYSDVMWRTMEDKQTKLAQSIKGMAIAYVIDQEVVFTDAVDVDFGNILCSADSFTEDWALNNVYSVNIIKDNEVIETVVCDEMIYSLLLSEAKVYDIDDGHEHARLVAEGWKFVDGTFKLPGAQE